MLKPVLLAASLMTVSPLQAQDIVGVESCAQIKEADKKFGCLQSNVEFLHRLIRKNEAAAQAKLREQEAKLREHETKLREETTKLTAASARTEALRAEIDKLKSAIDQLEKTVAKK